MHRSIEAQITPVGEEITKIYDVITAERIKERVIGIEGVYDVLGKIRTNTVTRAGAAVIFTIGTVTEFSKSLFPLISPDWTPLNRYPGLNQLSMAMEHPIGVGVLASIGAIYFGWLAKRNRTRSQAIVEELRHIQHPSGHIVEPDEPHDFRKDHDDIIELR